MTAVQEANKRIVQRAFDAWDEGRADLFDEVYAEDVAHPQMNLAEDVPVLKQMKDILRNWVEAFPDQSHDVHHMIAEED
jgi:ketosteroid isomerase-like protein